MFKIKATQILRNETYSAYVAVTRDAAQRRYGAFYKAIKIRKGDYRIIPDRFIKTPLCPDRFGGLRF